MRRLLVVSCVVSAFIVVGAIAFSMWRSVQLRKESERFTSLLEKMDSIEVTSDIVFSDEEAIEIFDSLIAENEFFNSVESDLNLEGLSYEEARDVVISELKDAIHWAKGFMAKSEQYEEEQRQFEQKLKTAQAVIAKLEHTSIDDFEEDMRMYLPDSYDAGDGDQMLNQILAGASLEDVVAQGLLPYKAEILERAKALNYMEPTPPRRGGLPPEEFDLYDPRRSRR